MRRVQCAVFERNHLVEQVRNDHKVANLARRRHAGRRRVLSSHRLAKASFVLASNRFDNARSKSEKYKTFY